MQWRNEQMEQNLDTFLRGNAFQEDGARLADAFKWHNRDGGGLLLWSFDAQGRRNLGDGVMDWAPNNIIPADYSPDSIRRNNGGPLVEFTASAANEYYNIVDAPWQESLTEEFLVWSWCLPSTLAADMAIAAKYDTAANQCSWWLGYDLSAGAFAFTANAGGNPANDVQVASTHAVVAGTPYYVAAYIEPGASMKIVVGAAAEGALVRDELTVGVPAGLFDTNADLTIGATDVQDKWFDGGIGITMGRVNVQPGNIDSHMGGLFVAGRVQYLE